MNIFTLRKYNLNYNDKLNYLEEVDLLSLIIIVSIENENKVLLLFFTKNYCYDNFKSARFYFA